MNRRYPLQAVLDMERCTVHELSTWTGIDYRTLKRWKRDGLAPRAAERLAHARGTHPVEFWPTFFDDLIAHQEELAERRRARNTAYKRRRRLRQREGS